MNEYINQSMRKEGRVGSEEEKREGRTDGRREWGGGGRRACVLATTGSLSFDTTRVIG